MGLHSLPRNLPEPRWERIFPDPRCATGKWKIPSESAGILRSHFLALRKSTSSPPSGKRERLFIYLLADRAASQRASAPEKAGGARRIAAPAGHRVALYIYILSLGKPQLRSHTVRFLKSLPLLQPYMRSLPGT
jgi:hypothetical protein